MPLNRLFGSRERPEEAGNASNFNRPPKQTRSSCARVPSDHHVPNFSSCGAPSLRQIPASEPPRRDIKIPWKLWKPSSYPVSLQHWKTALTDSASKAPCYLSTQASSLSISNTSSADANKTYDFQRRAVPRPSGAYISTIRTTAEEVDESGPCCPLLAPLTI
ncbi:hypothetical protein SKAU_G00048020 [Synaphobranchus kaupii]|uniref:Uncharacterized protein n=1 Tax=Synaphobranchus kaupii TaxID=118154 RepID=A0A9Q1J9H4_SYNKA|nr:hypothetical protein SKAU_G00048020 [Synaphobranchus kaupii]